MGEGKAERCVAALEAWLRGERVADLVPRDELTRLIREVRGDDAFWEAMRPRYERAWTLWEERLRRETRPVREVVSPEASERLLEGFERLEPDPEAVRTFLRSPAIETMLGSILYTGILEFIKKADLLGNLINRLPVIGPIRRKVMAAFQEEIETRLEGQVKGFLGGFSGLAVERMIQFVLSDENREGFRKARRRLGEHLLDRPVATLLPGAEAMARARDQVWEGLRRGLLEEQGEEELIASLYDEGGGRTLADLTHELPAPGRRLLASGLDRFWQSEAGRAWRPPDAT